MWVSGTLLGPEGSGRVSLAAVVVVGGARRCLWVWASPRARRCRVGCGVPVVC